jgi:hypothetical protein
MSPGNHSRQRSFLWVNTKEPQGFVVTYVQRIWQAAKAVDGAYKVVLQTIRNQYRGIHIDRVDKYSLSSGVLKKALLSEEPTDQMHRSYPFKAALAIIFT